MRRKYLKMFICFFFLALGVFSQAEELLPPPRVISRLPGQVGDSTNHLVSSVGHEVGNGLGTIADGVGEVPRAIGKAVGSVPEALGQGVGNVGDVGVEELRRLAQAVGETWRGAGQSIAGIIGSLRDGGGSRKKRSTSQLADLKGLDLQKQLGLVRSSLQKITNGTNRDICKLILLLESATTADQLDQQGANGVPLVSSLHNLLGRVNDAVCSGVDVKDSVDELVSAAKRF